MQDRIGANRADVAGITVLGLLHPLADVIKLLTKEDVVPIGANRVMHQLANRARVDPQLEMTECGANCGEAPCHAPRPPLYYKRTLNRAARFHAAHQVQNGYFAHTSSCTLVGSLDALYPNACDGAASCSCVGGVNQCSGSCSSFSQRVSLFGGGPSGEIIASMKS